jgi:hypothetical protein
MKTIFILGVGVVLGVGVCRGQAFETEQLILDVQKLAQLKQILTDLKEGYQVLDAGYSSIRDIAKGNFNLHKAYLDGLLAVSPTVRGYERIAAIVEMQGQMVSRYEAAWGAFTKSSGLRPEELALIGGVYGQLLAASVKDLGDLVNVVTDGVLRASDGERMRQIDVIYADMVEKMNFLGRLNNTTALLSLQRQGVAGEIQGLGKLYGMTP